jgi:hypothetical protein
MRRWSAYRISVASRYIRSNLARPPLRPADLSGQVDLRLRWRREQTLNRLHRSSSTMGVGVRRHFRLPQPVDLLKNAVTAHGKQACSPVGFI